MFFEKSGDNILWLVGNVIGVLAACYLWGTENVLSLFMQLFEVVFDFFFDWNSAYPLQAWSPHLVTVEMVDLFRNFGALELIIPKRVSKRDLHHDFNRPVLTDLIESRRDSSGHVIVLANPGDRISLFCLWVSSAICIISFGMFYDFLTRKKYLPTRLTDFISRTIISRLQAHICEHWRRIMCIMFFRASFSLGVLGM